MTAVPEAGKTKAVADAPFVPGMTIVPPGVSVELPMTNPDCVFPITVTPPTTMTAAVDTGGLVGFTEFPGVILAIFSGVDVPATCELDETLKIPAELGGRDWKNRNLDINWTSI